MNKKRLKKYLVSFLSASMLLSQGVSITYAEGISSPAEANKLGNVKEAKELEYNDLSHVFNGDFSKNSHWVAKTNNDSYNKLEGDNYYGIIEKGTSDDYLVQYVDVEPGKNYKLTAKVKVESQEHNEVPGVFLAVKYALNQNFKQVEIKKTDGWQTYEIEFTPAAGKRQVLVGLIKYATGNDAAKCNTATVSIDDVKVVQEKTSNTVVKWKDDFNGNSLDTNIWGYELGRIRGNEQQHYVDSEENVFVKDGKLTLKVTERPEEYKYTNPSGGDNARQIKYNSGSVRTIGQKEFLYGRIEMCAKLPKGKGAFPAFWTLGADFALDGLIDVGQAYGWPTCGEIDIMEMIGGPTNERLGSGEVAATKTGDQQSNKIVYGTPHFYWANTTDPDKDGSYGRDYDNASGGKASFREDLADEFHVYGINWTETKIEWYVDGEIYNVIYFDDLNDAQMQAAKASLSRPQYIQLNLATGGNWAGDAGEYLAEDNTQFVIDWVKWSQNSEQAAAAAEYYSDMPTLTSKLDSNDKNITITQGQDINSEDLLNYVELNAENTSTEYEVRYSIEDEFMFVNNGIGPDNNGQTKVQLVYSNSSENGLIDSLKDLEAGVYNIHYTAVPKGTTDGITDKVPVTSKLARKTLKLVVLPEELAGVEGQKLSSVTLPDGWSWENPETVLDKNINIYNAVFANTLNKTNLRKTVFTLPINVEENQGETTNPNILVNAVLSSDSSDNISEDSLKKVEKEVVTIVENILAGKEVTQVDDTAKKKIEDAVAARKTIVSKVIVNSKEANNVSETDKNSIDAIVKDNEKVANYLDIQVVISIDDEIVHAINNLSEEIEIKVNIPQEYQDKEIFYIVRLHDGKAEKLATKREGNILTFATDRFSTYALVYEENGVISSENIISYNTDVNTISGTNTTNTNSIVNTGDEFAIIPYVLLALCAMSGLVILKRKKAY